VCTTPDARGSWATGQAKAFSQRLCTSPTSHHGPRVPVIDGPRGPNLDLAAHPTEHALILCHSADIMPPIKLYYSPGASSGAPHAALRAAGLNFELVKVRVRHARSTRRAKGRTLSATLAWPTGSPCVTLVRPSGWGVRMEHP
jgi:hypothetical protein